MFIFVDGGNEWFRVSGKFAVLFETAPQAVVCARDGLLVKML